MLYIRYSFCGQNHFVLFAVDALANKRGIHFFTDIFVTNSNWKMYFSVLENQSTTAISKESNR